jgi:hypothetical protein
VRQGHLAEAQQELAHAYSAIRKEHSEFWQRVGINMAEAELGVVQKRWNDALLAMETITDIYTQLGNRWGRARGLLGWGEILNMRGDLADLEKARTLLRESLAVFDELGSRRYKAFALDRLQLIRERIYAQAVDREKLTQELAQAGRTQESLLPEKLPVIEGWHAAFRSSTGNIGDFYDYIPARWQTGILVVMLLIKSQRRLTYLEPF